MRVYVVVEFNHPRECESPVIRKVFVGKKRADAYAKEIRGQIYRASKKLTMQHRSVSVLTFKVQDVITANAAVLLELP